MAGLRKPRILIFDDEASILKVLEKYFSSRGYEVFSFAEPVVCPVYQGGTASCANLRPCADMVMTDFRMDGMNGVELLEGQRKRGCRLEMDRKAIMSGFMTDDELESARGLGCALFKKPFALSDLSCWVESCEKRMDLSRSVGAARKESRVTINEKIKYCWGDGSELREGTLVNISDSGLCLKVQTPPPGNPTVTIKTELSNCCQSGDVRWVKTEENDHFMVGLNCD